MQIICLKWAQFREIPVPILLVVTVIQLNLIFQKKSLEAMLELENKRKYIVELE